MLILQNQPLRGDPIWKSVYFASTRTIEIVGKFLTCVWLIQVVSPSALAQRDEAAWKVIHKAIEAHGGNERLSAITSLELTANWKSGGKQGLAASGKIEAWIQFPNHSRSLTTILSDGRCVSRILSISNGKTTWEKEDSLEVREIPAKDTSKSQPDLILPLRLLLSDDRRTTASLTGRRILGKSPCVDVRITHPDFVEVLMTFDQEKGLLLRTETKLVDPTKPTPGIPSVRLFEQYRTIDDIVLPQQVQLQFADALLVLDCLKIKCGKHPLDPKLFHKP